MLYISLWEHRLEQPRDPTPPTRDTFRSDFRPVGRIYARLPPVGGKRRNSNTPTGQKGSADLYVAVDGITILGCSVKAQKTYKYLKSVGNMYKSDNRV